MAEKMFFGGENMLGPVEKMIRKYHIPEECVQGLPYDGVLLQFESLEEAEYYSRILQKNRVLHVELNWYAWTVRVFRTDKWALMIKEQHRMAELTDMFFLALKNGKTQKEARKEQEDYCKEHPEYLASFRMIYT